MLLADMRLKERRCLTLLPLRVSTATDCTAPDFGSWCTLTSKLFVGYVLFWAHSDSQGLPLDAPDSQAQLLAEHLDNVSQLAWRFAEAAAPLDTVFQTMARSAGMLHDLGKYTACFQRMLAGARVRCPHAIYGALAALEDPSGQTRVRAYPVAAVIAAHHAGLKDRTELTAKLLAKDQRQAERNELRRFWDAAVRDQPAVVEALQTIPSNPSSPGVDLFIRMLLSCLVDADRLDTARRPNRQRPLESSELLAQLASHLLRLETNAAARGTAGSLLQARAGVQEACHKAALGPGKLFSLSVPTGGGKTLAAMRFALERTAAHPGQYRRILVVIPYLSIIEQNAAVYRQVFGNDAVLEHHSGAAFRLRTASTQHGGRYFEPLGEDEGDPHLSSNRAATENWDAPIIVTTSVRFIESLFSNHPSDLVCPSHKQPLKPALGSRLYTKIPRPSEDLVFELSSR